MISVSKPQDFDIALKVKEDPSYYGQQLENGCTERVRFLNKDLRSRKAGVDLHRARCYTKIYRDRVLLHQDQQHSVLH